MSKGEKHDSCIGCDHYLYGGHCRINAEAKCREGGGYELWEPKKGGEEHGGCEVDKTFRGSA